MLSLKKESKYQLCNFCCFVCYKVAFFCFFFPNIAAKEGTRGSSGNLVDAARHWVEKHGLLPSSEELPLTESFPSFGGLFAVRSKLLHLYGTCEKEPRY